VKRLHGELVRFLQAKRQELLLAAPVSAKGRKAKRGEATPADRFKVVRKKNKTDERRTIKLLCFLT
jgi:hypothetical protein